jgi:polyhydroxyalkanoate synthesis regulator phasin
MVFVLMNGQSSSSVVEEVVVAPAVERPGPSAGMSADRAGAPAVPAAKPSPDAFVAPKPVDLARLEAVQKKIEALSMQASPDIDEADALFEELIDIQGSHIISGVDLNLIRRMLHVSRDLRKATDELAAERNKPEPDAAKVKSLEEEVAALQNRLQAVSRGQSAGVVLPRARRP